MVWIIATRGIILVIPGELVADSNVVSVKAHHFIIWQYGDLGFSFIWTRYATRKGLIIPLCFDTGSELWCDDWFFRRQGPFILRIIASTPGRSFYLYGSTLIVAWISNHIPNEAWAAHLGLGNGSIILSHGCNYLPMLRFKLIPVSKRGPGGP